MARPRQTLMDYMVIGISPALIMGMVGSLLFFLLAVFYRGEYPERLTFICAMFTLAIVLIARISMERGIEYASLFGLALAGVTFLAMSRFVVITGPLESLSGWINCLLIAVVWWSAHKLTWDCTFIDDQHDASGEGLLQAVGFDTDTVERQVDAVRSSGPQTPAAEDGGRRPAADQRRGPEWYQRMVARRRRPHTPGVWVLYYALAALPLFGLGQWLIPASDVESRWHAFRLICVYVACALGLLLTTSFLGLRRYLRQRNLQMPLDMAGLWLGMGAVMIVAVLLVCTVLPRPGATLTISQLPFGFGSPSHQRTNRHALGNDGPERPRQSTHTTPPARPQPTAPAPSSGQQPPATTSDGPGAQQSSQSRNGQAQDGPQSQADQQTLKLDPDAPKADEQGAPRQSSGAPRQSTHTNPQARPQPTAPAPSSGQQPPAATSDGPGAQQSSKPRNEQAQDGPHSQADQQALKPDPDAPKAGEQGAPRESNEPPHEPAGPPRQSNGTLRESAGAPRESNDAPRESSSASRVRPPWSASRALTTVAGVAGNLLKLLFLAALVVVAGYFAWKHRAELCQGIAHLWRDWLNLWASLVGRRPSVDHAAAEAAAEEPAAPPLPSFASYRNPFAAGLAGRCAVEELVRYSFEALEAWGREHGCAREEDQTPLEYAQRLARQHARIGPETQVLADLYCRVAYGHEQLAARRRDDLRRLWQQLQIPAE